MNFEYTLAPDFRVNGRIFASLHDDDQFAMANLTPEQQASFLGEHPGTFAPESGAWGRQGYTRVRLASVDEETLGEAMTLAWQNTVRKAAAAPRSKSAGAAKPRRPPGRK
jgi:hypothetical protein